MGDLMRDALKQIQELHGLARVVQPIYSTNIYRNGPIGSTEYKFCAVCNTAYPCPTRRLADRGLGETK